MAEWRPLHQSVRFRSGLEAGGQSYDPPLLPYEKSLITALDCSEEEYKKFVRYAMQRAYVRPAEYDRIPNIKAELVILGTTLVTAAGAKTAAGVVVTNLAIGLALTAASLLLAPKAPSAEPPAKIKGKKLADQIGPSRFNQATSFDNVASLASLNQPIPIPFGKRGTGADGNTTGGITLVPALVWSRLYAYGKYQAFEGVYVVGEQGVDSPDLGGIVVGTAPLTAAASADYAFYWSSKKGSNRPSTLLHGTQGSGATGTVGREVFTAPQDEALFGTGFSMAYTPSGDTTFGAGTPIRNGTTYRFNWEIVSAPFSQTKGEDNRDAGDEVRAKRLKIAGSDADVLHIAGEEAGQPGVGRAYSCHMGFINYAGTEYADKTIVNVTEGETAIFEIYEDNKGYKEQAKKDFKGTEVNLNDLINDAKTWRERASELIAVGTRWIVGGSTWIVSSRTKSGDSIFIRFKCISVIGNSDFGIAGTRQVRQPLGGYEGKEFAPLKHCGAAFYNLCRLHTASIRPVRRDAHVIELGIRSQVWNRASGLCNFNAIPSPKKLFQSDKNDIQLSTGRMDKYFKRSSCFIVHVRPVKQYGEPPSPFLPIPQVFCVQGSAPLDQYNFLRIRRKQPGYFEYKIFPVTGADVAINMKDDEEVIILDSSVTENGVAYSGLGAGIGKPFSNAYGTFQMTTHGRVARVGDLRANGELFTDPSDAETTITPTNVPTSLGELRLASNTGSGQLIRFSLLTHFLGDAATQQNQKVSAEEQLVVGSRSVTVKIEATSAIGVEKVDISPKYIEANGGSRYHWAAVSFTVSDANGDWSVGEEIPLTANVSNKFSTYAASIGQGYSSVTLTLRVNSVGQVFTGELQKGERRFELNSQLADCSHYTQLTKSNEQGPEHEVVYINEFISNDTVPNYDDMSTVGFTIKSSGEVSGVQQLRMWSPTGINVTRLIEGDNKPSNLFADLVYYLLSSKTQGVGNVVPSELIDEDALRTTARFLRANKIFYDGVVEDAESFRSFLYDTAPLQLCTFTIKNGRFGMQPALPYDENHEISLNPIQVDQIFTAGNIIEGSLQLQYIDVSQRANIRALVSWRQTVENDLPDQVSALVYWSDLSVDKQSTTEQSFDLSEFCTNREQALRTARFLLSTRRRVTKTVNFKTVPDALGVQPGSYIRVITEASTYSSTANGSITDAGTLVSITTIKDGDYEALLYNPTTQEVTETTITVADNAISDSQYHGSFFTLLSGSTDYSVYQIESLNLEGDGLVSISAVEVPTDASGVSIVAKDVLTPGNFTVLE